MYTVRVKLIGQANEIVMDEVAYSGLQPDYPENNVYFFQDVKGNQIEVPLSSVYYIQYGKGRFNGNTEGKTAFTTWFKTIDLNSSVQEVRDVVYCGLNPEMPSLYYIIQKSGESYEIPLHSLAYLRFSKERLDRKDEEQKSDQQKL